MGLLFGNVGEGRVKRGLSPKALRRTLGTFWIIDGLAKFQPGLIDRGEEAYFFAMSAMSAPGPSKLLILHFMHMFLSHPELWWALGATEVSIGAALLSEKMPRIALSISVVWALGVWIIGQGSGGVTEGVASIATGYPGSALLYLVTSLVLWPRRTQILRPVISPSTVASEGLLRRFGTATAWAVLWLGAAAFQLVPQVGPNSLDATIYLNSREGPSVLRSMDFWALRWVSYGRIQLLTVVIAASAVLVALLVFADLLPRIALALGVSLAAVGWVIGQNLGGIFTGSATDIGSGPIWILLALTLWPRRVPCELDHSTKESSEYKGIFELKDEASSESGSSI